MNTFKYPRNKVFLELGIAVILSCWSHIYITHKQTWQNAFIPSERKITTLTRVLIILRTTDYLVTPMSRWNGGGGGGRVKRSQPPLTSIWFLACLLAEERSVMYEESWLYFWECQEQSLWTNRFIVLHFFHSSKPSTNWVRPIAKIMNIFNMLI